MDCDPQYGINKLVRLIKGTDEQVSAGVAPLAEKNAPLWTNSYFVAPDRGKTILICFTTVTCQLFSPQPCPSAGWSTPPVLP